jgi:DNA-3-methyladenine glycosylase
MIRNRNKKDGGKKRKVITGRFLTNGPAKLCQAFGIGREENGTDLLESEIYVTRGTPVRHSEVQRSKRIGIRNGRDKKWRFFLENNRWVSRAP